MSSVEDDEETWEEFFLSNKPLPPHATRNLDDSPGSRKYTFCLNLKSIDAVLQSQVKLIKTVYLLLVSVVEVNLVHEPLCIASYIRCKMTSNYD